MESANKIRALACLVVLTASLVFAGVTHMAFGAPQLSLTTGVNKSAYYVRENVIVSGSVTFDGVPVSDAFVALELHSQNDVPMAYRTVKVGNPSESWILNITDISLWDKGSPPKKINTVKVGQTVEIRVTVLNPQLTQRDHVYVAISPFDGNMLPLRPYLDPDNSIPAQRDTIIYYSYFDVPRWAYSGLATVYANLYDSEPSKGGKPYIPEASAQFYISRTDQGWFDYSTSGDTYVPAQATGDYSLTLGLPPTLTPGTYPIYSSARYRDDMIIYYTTAQTTFNTLYAPYPPTASFVWTPPQPYPNSTVTFDASSSSAEGYNDTIVRYEWDWGDGTPRDITTSPTITHKFMATSTYIVTLNVTDEEDLWSLTQKPITTRQTNPTAVFAWIPEVAIVNTTVTFDASSSLPGWSIRTASPAPIATYVWNFGDGTGNFSVPSPNSVIEHTYQTIENFTTLLEVIDTEGQRNAVTHLIQVINVTARPWDINNDAKCDIKDIAIVAKAFGSEPGDPNWNPKADITGPTPLVPDWKVDVRDIALVAKHFGEVY